MGRVYGPQPAYASGYASPPGYASPQSFAGQSGYAGQPGYASQPAPSGIGAAATQTLGDYWGQGYEESSVPDPHARYGAHPTALQPCSIRSSSPGWR